MSKREAEFQTSAEHDDERSSAFSGPWHTDPGRSSNSLDENAATVFQPPTFTSGKKQRKLLVPGIAVAVFVAGLLIIHPWSSGKSGNVPQSQYSSGSNYGYNVETNGRENASAQQAGLSVPQTSQSCSFRSQTNRSGSSGSNTNQLGSSESKTNQATQAQTTASVTSSVEDGEYTISLIPARLQQTDLGVQVYASLYEPISLTSQESALDAGDTLNLSRYGITGGMVQNVTRYIREGVTNEDGSALQVMEITLTGGPVYEFNFLSKYGKWCLMDEFGGMETQQDDNVRLLFAENVQVLDQMTAILDGYNTAYQLEDVFALSSLADSLGVEELDPAGITVKNGYVTKLIVYYGQ